MALAPQPPLPAPPVLTPPMGWLGWLGIKSGGSQPGQVSAYLQPIVEMDRFYRAGARQVLVPSGTNTAAVYQNSTAVIAALQVPPGHVWHVEHIQANSGGALGVAAGVIANLQITDAGGTPIYSEDPNPRAYLTGETAVLNLHGPMILLPSYAIRVFTTATAAPTAFSWFISAIGPDVLQ